MSASPLPNPLPRGEREAHRSGFPSPQPGILRAMTSRRVLARMLIALVGVASASGCARALFPADEARTQFDGYNLVRQRSVPAEEPDVFGNPQPALRARLGQTR